MRDFLFVVVNDRGNAFGLTIKRSPNKSKAKVFAKRLAYLIYGSSMIFEG